MSGKTRVKRLEGKTKKQVRKRALATEVLNE
jgi:hypothetical protein